MSDIDSSSDSIHLDYEEVFSNTKSYKNLMLCILEAKFEKDADTFTKMDPFVEI